MEIKIETETEVSPKEVFEYLKEKCLDAFQSFKIKIENSEFFYERKKDESKTSS